MANEFKIKTGLLLGPSPTQPVISIQNASTAIIIDASSILLTGKAIYDYVNPIFSKNAAQDASIMRLDASLNNAIEGGSVYIKNASLGTDFYWAGGYLEVSAGGGGGSMTLSGLTDVSISDLSTNQFLRYDYATSKWKNVSPVEASLYFWPLSTSLIRESSIGTGFNWNAGMLDVSTTGSGGAGLSIKETSSNYTALSNYIILANSSWNTIDITLPASPANGDIVQVIDINKNASINNINILRNTHRIDMSTNNFTLDVNGGSIELIYHALNDNFAILNLEILEEFTGSTPVIGDVTKVYVDGSLAARDVSIANLSASINRIDSSINALFTLVLDTSVLEIGTPTVDGSWRLVIDTSGNLSVQKRITGSWVEKGNFN
jgi:hypothetical protein